MNKKKRANIQEQLETFEKTLSNAAEYVARNVNVEGTSWLHFDDWLGKSGHPSWMRNFMIPTVMKHRARKEKALLTVNSKTKGKELTRRRKQRTM
jgi:hypothetical protein